MSLAGEEDAKAPALFQMFLLFSPRGWFPLPWTPVSSALPPRPLSSSVSAWAVALPLPGRQEVCLGGKHEPSPQKALLRNILTTGAVEGGVNSFGTCSPQAWHFFRRIILS